MRTIVALICVSMFFLIISGSDSVATESVNAAPKGTVAVIGTGDMGDSFGPRLAVLGYRIVYGSRNPGSDKVIALVERPGHGATATSQKEAAQQADVVLLAIPWPVLSTRAITLSLPGLREP